MAVCYGFETLDSSTLRFSELLRGLISVHSHVEIFRALRSDCAFELNEAKDSLNTRNIQSAGGRTNSAEFNRIQEDGIICLRVLREGKWLGIVFNDFRIHGGSFGSENSAKLQSFFSTLLREQIPAVFLLNSLGVRFMEGRTVFQQAFGLIPVLRSFASRQPLITVAVGRCLGLGALLFGLGQYRLALAEDGLINLTGPEVIRLFFGEKVDFKGIASPESHFENNELIHEILPNKAVLPAKIDQLLGISYSDVLVTPCHNSKIAAEMDLLLTRVTDRYTELFSSYAEAVRVILAEKNGIQFGIFVNPPGSLYNLISVEALLKYRMGLEYFKALKLPVISVLDTPGIDPRFSENQRRVINTICETADSIIAYPYPKMGILKGRSFGGATVLGFPKIFGSQTVIAVRGTQAGVMHESIIEKLLEGSERLTKTWTAAKARHTSDLKDMMEAGIVDALIEPEELSGTVDRFLESNQSQPFLDIFNRGQLNSFTLSRDSGSSFREERMPPAPHRPLKSTELSLQP